MDKFLDFLLNLHGPMPYFACFGILLACGVGLPLPEDITLFACGLSAYYGLTDLWIIILVAYAGVIVGDSIIFWLGSAYGQKLTNGWFFRKILPAERLNLVKTKFHEKGNKLIFIARFMPGLRAPIYFSAGTLHLPYRVFLFYDGLAALLSVPVIVGAVFYFGDELDKVVRVIQRVEHSIALVIVLVAVIVGFRWYVNNRKPKKKISAGL